MAQRRVSLISNEDLGALRAFGLSTITTDSVYAEPRWDYIGEHERWERPNKDGSPRKARKIKTRKITRGSIGQFGAQLQQLAQDAEALTLTAGQAYAASLHPQGKHNAVLAAEHWATRFLHAHGERATRPDVWNPNLKRHLALRDPVAQGAEPRWEPAQPCTYGARGNHPAWVTRAAVRLAQPAQSDTPHWEALAVAEGLTTLPIGEHFAALGIPAANERHAWRGHRKVVLSLSERAGGAHVARAQQSAQRQAERAEMGAGTRGPAVESWAMSVRSLARAVASRGVTGLALDIAALLNNAAQGDTFTGYGPVTITILGGGRCEARGVVMTITEAARRAALAL